MVKLKFECGHIVEANYHGKHNVQGGETWAFWTREGDPIGYYDPVGWQSIEPE